MKCRACEHEHPAGMRCEMAKRIRETAAWVTHAPPEVTHAAEAVTHKPTPVTHKLTAAEKQRAYRQRHADRLRPANAERMRADRAKGAK